MKINMKHCVFSAQHVMNEIVDVTEVGCPLEWLNIPIPEELREKYDGATVLPFRRGQYDTETGQSSAVPREQV